jgi:hypothetical protein
MEDLELYLQEGESGVPSDIDKAMAALKVVGDPLSPWSRAVKHEVTHTCTAALPWRDPCLNTEFLHKEGTE